MEDPVSELNLAIIVRYVFYRSIVIVTFPWFVDTKHSAIGTPTLLFPVEIIATQETKIQVPIGEVRWAARSWTLPTDSPFLELWDMSREKWWP